MLFRSGPVVVKGGALRGVGTIEGAVNVAGVRNGPVNSTFLAPGTEDTTGPGTLTILSSVSIGPIAVYQVILNQTSASQVIANGVTINNASIEFTHLPHGSLPPGTMFTIIDNTSVSPIVGTFLNLADGGTFSRFDNTYQANYEGGDGNDLTLTVQ